MRKAEVHLNILFQILMGLSASSGWPGSIGAVHERIYLFLELSYIKINIFSPYITRQTGSTNTSNLWP